nr:protein-disulfide reductase DsbD N-terminal domain-containing protein [Agitococcus sp.]
MRLLLIWLMLCLSMATNAQVPNFDDIAAEEDYLEVEQAFKPVLTVQDEHVLLSFTVADGYYLYKKRIVVNAATATPIAMGQVLFSTEPHVKNDPNFGRVEIFDKSLNVDIPVYATQNSDVGREVAVNASYQGCSAQGLCYPPQ